MNPISILNDLFSLLAQSLVVVPLVGAAGLLAVMVLEGVGRKPPLQSQRFGADNAAESPTSGLLYSVAAESVFDAEAGAANGRACEADHRDAA